MTELFIRWHPGSIREIEAKNLDKPTSIGMIGNMILEDLGTYRNITEFIICREHNPRMHFHIYLKDNEILNWEDDKVRVKYRRLIKKVIKGEVYISKETVKDKIKAIAYVVKEDDYWGRNVNWLDLLEAKKVSFKKVDSYKKRMKDWFEDDSNEKKSIRDLVDIYKDFNIPIYKDKLAGLVRSKLCKQTKEYYDRVCELIEDAL